MNLTEQERTELAARLRAALEAVVRSDEHPCDVAALRRVEANRLVISWLVVNQVDDVRTARAFHTWDRIAEALCVSRSAAIQKYRSLLG